MSEDEQADNPGRVQNHDERIMRRAEFTRPRMVSRDPNVGNSQGGARYGEAPLFSFTDAGSLQADRVFRLRKDSTRRRPRRLREPRTLAISRGDCCSRLFRWRK